MNDGMIERLREMQAEEQRKHSAVDDPVNDLVERLRANAEDYTGELQCEAADRIESLTRDLAEARGKAIEECAKVVEARVYHSDYPSDRETLKRAAKAVRALIQKDRTL